MFSSLHREVFFRGCFNNGDQYLQGYWQYVTSLHPLRRFTSSSLSPSLACMDTFPLFRTPGGLILDQYRSRPRSAAMASTLRPQVLNSPPHFTFISSNAVVSKRYAPFESPHCSFLHLWFQISTAQSTFHSMIHCWSCVDPLEFFFFFLFVFASALPAV